VLRSLSWRCSIAITLLFVLPATAPAAEPTDAIDDTVADFFRPFQNDLATLAPDGRHLAMTETLRDKPPIIVIVNLDDRTSQRYAVASDAEHAVLQLQWVTPKRLVFTTRSRAVGALELESGEIKALLRSRDLDGFQPDPILGPRSHNAIITPDMEADASRVTPLDFDTRREITVREALAQARVTGDLFGSDSKRDAGRALRPFLLGLKPGAANTVLIELRTDGDLYAYRRGERTQLTVGGNVYIADRNAPPPSSISDLGGDDGRRGEYATYSVDVSPPPLVVLELDTAKGRTREVAVEQNWRRVWLDHQGRLRIALEQQGKRFRYLYRDADAKKWIPLDSVAKTPTPLGFTAGADTLLGARSVPLGFDGNGRSLFIATNVGRDTFALRALDLANGQLQEFEVGHDRYDMIEPTVLTAGDVLRFDRHTHSLAGVRFAAARRDTQWFDKGMTALQAQLNKQLAPQRGELREWNADRTRFLVEVAGPGDPGGFLVVDTANGKMIRCGERAPWLTEAKRNVTREFDLLTDGGQRLAGYLTLPQKPRLSPPPVLVYFHDGPWFSDPPLFNRGAQALAALGFAVLQLNHRGSSGRGRSHLNAIDGSLDRVVLQDIQAMLTRAAAGKLPINTKMVATLGNGIGGYLAVRMAQLAPETFRCAVAINAPGDLDAWRTHPETAPTVLADLRQHAFGTDREALRAQSAVTAGPTTRAPVLVVHGTQNAYVPISLGRDLYRALKKGAEETAYLELPGEGHGGWSEKTTAKLFAELGRFFNATIYTYDVKLRTPEVVK
jgi:dipeptidyl aminopeptidase/acylaminoacyl peptidase